MILVDTSAWIEYLRATGSPTDRGLGALLRDEQPLSTTDVVVMELLAGARDDRHRDELRRLLYGRCRFTAVEGPDDYERAAELYRLCRRAGETVRALTDCLIAIVALRTEADVLHRDADFEAIARHTGLAATTA